MPTCHILSTSEHIGRSIAAHALFAIKHNTLSSPTYTSGTAPEDRDASVSTDRLRAILSAVLVRAWPREAPDYTKEVAANSRDELVVGILTNTFVFARLKSIRPTSTLGKSLRAALTTRDGLRRLAHLDACGDDGTPWTYVLQFTVTSATHKPEALWNPATFNGSCVLIRLEDARDNLTVECLSIGTGESLVGAQLSSQRRSAFPRPIESVLKFALMKTRLVELAMSHCLSRPPNTIVPIGSLAREVRREYYRKYIVPSAASLGTSEPPFNLLVREDNRDYDSTMVSVESQTPTPMQGNSKAYETLRRDWTTVRTLTTQRTMRKLLVEQILVFPISPSDVDGSKYACIDVIELQNSGDGYPWGVRCVQVEGSCDFDQEMSITDWWVAEVQPLKDSALKVFGDIAKNDPRELQYLNLNCLLFEVQSGLGQAVLPGMAEFMMEHEARAKVRQEELLKSIKNYNVDNSGYESENPGLLEERLADTRPTMNEHVLSGLAGYTARLFGSSLTTLASTTSDADVTILLDNVLDNPTNHPISNMYLVASVLRQRGMQKVFAVATARVPIVKFYDPEYGLHADVNVGNSLGIENSRMVCEYMRLDARLRDVIVLVKYWAARRGLNDSSRGGTFSSYALILMVVHCMQLHGHLPSLQMLYPDSEPRKYVVSRPNARFIRSSTEKKNAMADASLAFKGYKARLTTGENCSSDKLDLEVNLPRIRLKSHSDPMSSVAVSDIPVEMLNERGLVKWDVSFVEEMEVIKNFESVAPTLYIKLVLGLLHEFFYHFGYKHVYKANSIVSVRCGRAISQSEAHEGLNVGKSGRGGAAEGQQLVVEDPFQLDRNTTGMVKRIGFVVGEFRRMAGLLAQDSISDWAKMLEEAFSEREKK
ncbi:hypothetical protein HDU82_001539 [Entophlyctis luteolus]|nr:hypothetical protein HDU82_001539 [Entophlyctis luteolus]